ncbi:hypothetical protein [Streptomyces sp. NBC_01006]|uniref:hypothetical protein n=1 Tax=Streptomyces sp. NBC_01006 TaxID=2903716 RepID=UPI00386520EE|nr:hypothetical protein OG509_01690 [Streptomyces sp. NBC_01006]
MWAALILLRPSLWSALDGNPRGGDNWNFSRQAGRIGIRHHPESHFWPLQPVESAILLALSAAAIVGAFPLLRRRHR